MEHLFLKVSEEYDDIRIDKCIQLLLEKHSRTYIQKLIKDGNVLLNSKTASASNKVYLDDIIELSIPDAVELDIKPENIPLDILYEDDDIVIVNKPKGMVVHPAPGHYSGTMVNALLYHCKGNLSGINGILRPGIVHRIDMNTTGSVIICKNNESHQIISDLLKVHGIDRRYRALVHGRFNEESGTIEGAIGRNPNDRKKMMIHAPNGKPAVTHYKVLKQFDKYAYIECKLETGRTHQIRVHMASINHPIVGDDVYSNRKEEFRLEGQTLHAWFLGFNHPKTGEYLEIEAPLPNYFLHLLDILNE
ncbi:MAG: RluA family pseudouridine synthase [Lachnospiraceae bacterium]|nr:RluA family pseudouridine synthase [Lachnospiraceae bacterium]